MRTVYGRMKELAEKGVRFNLVMSPASGTSDYATLGHFDRLMSFAGTAIESFEGLNEHDLSQRPLWAAEAQTFQKALYSTVKNTPATGGLRVYGPSMGRPESASQVGDLSPYMDFGSIHPYPGGQVPDTGLARHTEKTLVMNGGRPLVATETGYHTAMAWSGEHPPVSERAMARYVPRLFLEYWNAGIARTWLYEFVDEGSDQAKREQCFGLLRADGSEKPAYGALRNLLTLLTDPSPAGLRTRALAFTLTGDLTDIHHALLQKRDGRFYLILWQEVASYDLQSKADVAVPIRSLQIEFPKPVSRVRVLEPLRSLEPTEQARGVGQYTLSVPDAPLVIEITR
jgi:hypothetical protein